MALGKKKKKEQIETIMLPFQNNGHHFTVLMMLKATSWMAFVMSTSLFPSAWGLSPSRKVSQHSLNMGRRSFNELYSQKEDDNYDGWRIEGTLS